MGSQYGQDPAGVSVRRNAPQQRGARVANVGQPVAGPASRESGPWLRVVGVVSDVRRSVGGPPPGDVYMAVRQAGRLWLTVVARGRPGVAPADVLAGIEAELHRLDPVVPFSETRDVAAAVNDAMAPTRFLATLFGGFSAFALLLAVVGLYGVVAYAARQRRRDVAIRKALGASSGDARTARGVTGVKPTARRPAAVALQKIA